MMRDLIVTHAVGAALAVAGFGFAQAAEPALIEAPAVVQLSIPAPSAQTQASGDEVATPDSELADLAGGTNTAVALSDQDLTAISSGNQVTGNVIGSGSISFSDGALAGFGGIGNFVLNTGHNNNLQGAINVTIVVTN